MFESPWGYTRVGGWDGSLSRSASSTVLEIPCGAGNPTAVALENQPGPDASAEMVAVATARFGGTGNFIRRFASLPGKKTAGPIWTTRIPPRSWPSGATPADPISGESSRPITGDPYQVFLNKVRLDQAASLLRESDQSILNISLYCGFGSLSRFHHLFKSACGASPTQFRHPSWIS